MNKILEDYYKVRKEHDDVLKLLDEEVIRIITIIKKVFKRKNAWWSYKYYEGEHAEPPLPETLDNLDDKEYFPIYISEEADTRNVAYGSIFPIKFFDMTDQEIEDFLKKEIEEDKLKEKEESEKTKKDFEKRKIAKEELKISIKKKLTKEELKMLKIK